MTKIQIHEIEKKISESYCLRDCQTKKIDLKRKERNGFLKNIFSQTLRQKIIISQGL